MTKSRLYPTKTVAEKVAKKLLSKTGEEHTVAPLGRVWCVTGPEPVALESVENAQDVDEGNVTWVHPTTVVKLSILENHAKLVVVKTMGMTLRLKWGTYTIYVPIEKLFNHFLDPLTGRYVFYMQWQHVETLELFCHVDKPFWIAGNYAIKDFGAAFNAQAHVLSGDINFTQAHDLPFVSLTGPNGTLNSMKEADPSTPQQPSTFDALKKFSTGETKLPSSKALLDEINGTIKNGALTDVSQESVVSKIQSLASDFPYDLEGPIYVQANKLKPLLETSFAPNSTTVKDDSGVWLKVAHAQYEPTQYVGDHVLKWGSVYFKLPRKKVASVEQGGSSKETCYVWMLVRWIDVIEHNLLWALDIEPFTTDLVLGTVEKMKFKNLLDTNGFPTT